MTTGTKLIIGGCSAVLVVGAILMGALGYGVFKVADKVTGGAISSAARESASGGAASRENAPPVEDACTLLTTAEAAAILGVPVVRQEKSSPPPSCAYFLDGKAASEASKAEADQALAKAKSNQADPKEFANALMKGMGGMAGASGAEVKGLTLRVRAGEDGASSMGGLKGASSMLKGAIGDSNTKAPEDLQGLGDEAAMAPMDMILMVRKGNRYIELEPGPIANHRAKLIAAARKILERL